MARTCRAPIVAALVLSLVGLAATPGVAEDGIGPSSLSQCGASSFCVWGSVAYSGAFKGTTSTTAVNLTFSQVRSVWNRSSRAARVYSGPDGTGASVCYDPGKQIASVSVAAASIRVLPTSAC